ncbi:MAG: SOS response-associated peptidase [Alphaproteobacteria bacterium]|nr:MAG: SOS response-associated peptidase [Alphaproteobacteria bacterium]
MCGRYVLTSPPEAVAALFEISGDVPNYPPRYNIAPTQPVPVVHCGVDGTGPLKLSLMRWGLVPHWSKGPDSRFSMINARAETLASKPAYRGAFRYRRCLLPANGFYEWKALPKGPRQPYFIAMGDGGLIFFAGLWEHWLGPDGSELASVTIVTTGATGVVREVHDRMPVILCVDEGRDWISGAGGRQGLAELLDAPAPIGLTAVPVSRRVNDPTFDDPSCLEPSEG